MENIAYIYQPHFNTQMFRVAVNKQQSPNFNYIVVTCSPQYNGIWRYSGKLHNTCGRWANGATICYEIPISSCDYVMGLDEITKQTIKDKVIDQQFDWYMGRVKNKSKHRSGSYPEWFLYKGNKK